MQLEDHEFTAWLDRLMEARRNRQEKQQRPYRAYHRPYNENKQSGDKWNKPQLRNKIKPAQELEVQYDDVVETADFYNLDVEECMTA